MAAITQSALIEKYVGRHLDSLLVHPRIAGLLAMALYQQPDYVLSEISEDAFPPEVWNLVRDWVIEFVHNIQSCTRRLADFNDPAGRPQFPRAQKYGSSRHSQGPRPEGAEPDVLGKSSMPSRCT